MKLGYMAVADENLQRHITFGQDAGMQYMELAYVYLPNKGGVTFNGEEVKAMMDKTTMKVSSVGLFNFNPARKDAAEQEEAKKYYLGLFDAGQTLGAEIAMMSPGNLADASEEENLAKFKENYAYYEAEAAKRGLKLALYLGDNESFIKSPEMVRKALAVVPHMNIKMDTMGVVQKLGADPYEYYKEFKDNIVHFHAHEIVKFAEGYVEPAVGMGDINWGKMMGILTFYGYDGYVIIEPHGRRYVNGENRCEHITMSRRTLEKYFY